MDIQCMYLRSQYEKYFLEGRQDNYSVHIFYSCPVLAITLNFQVSHLMPFIGKRQLTFYMIECEKWN